MKHPPTDRPQAPAPIIDNIPAELRARAQWVIWRYELDKNNKWTKIPYRLKTKKAATNRPAEWLPFDIAIAEYQTRRDIFDGIGYVFAKDDPYVGGDFDHCLHNGTLSDFAQQHLPPTYAEISPSGTGIKYIARASGTYGRKTAIAEVYSSKRFFTFTGNVLPGHTAIIEAQDKVDALLAALGRGSTRTVREGSAVSGQKRLEIPRSELVTQIPESEWAAGRQELRTNIHRNVARVRAAAKEETQLAFLLRGDYAGFHAKWPFVGLYRGDGSLDESQVRAVVANGIRGRGFTFPEYAAVMTHLFGAAALAKWGTKQAWREELAALWFKAQEPRRSFVPRTPTPKVKRGRAGNHADLVERIYCQIEEHRAGADAIVKIGDLAQAIGANRRTISTVLVELREAGRISWRRLGQYGGLVITFSDVIYSPAADAVSPQPDAAIEPPPAAAEETRVQASCVSSQDAPADHISEPQPEPAHSGAAPPTLEALAREYLSTPAWAIGRSSVNRDTGLVTSRRSRWHFAELVAPYGYDRDEAIAAYKAERERQVLLERLRWKRWFTWLDGLSDADLLAYVGRRVPIGVAALAREEAVFTRHEYLTRLKHARQALDKRGLTLPSRKTKTTLYQAPKPEPAPLVYDTVGMFARLKRDRDRRTQQAAFRA